MSLPTLKSKPAQKPSTPSTTTASCRPGSVLRILFVVLLAAILQATLSTVALAERPAPGYQPRACGFDLDDDGVFGEPEDCRVCDGSTLDPDGDGVAEDLIYVDCDAGQDLPNCGDPRRPCRSLGWAWGSIADGPGDGAEDIVCFRGTCRDVENASPSAGGVPGTYTLRATGSEARDWLRPRDPAMLVGWDHDADGVYPPEDRDDVAVLDGSNGLSRTFRIDSHVDHLEMAHFTVRDYGRYTDAFDSGFLRFGPSYDVLEFHVYHDLELVGINQDRATTSSNSLVNLFPTNTIPQWILFENLDVVDNGQWFVRGSGYDSGPDMGPFRFARISRTAHSCDYEDCGTSAGSTAFKLWGYLSGVEILDSVWDANVRAWNPKTFGGPSGSTFAYAAQCTRDWTVRNNWILDYKNPFVIKGYENYYCNYPDARPVDGIVIDANLVWNTFEPWTRGDHGVRVEGAGPKPGEQVGNVAITNNYLASSTGWEAAIWIWAGNEEEPPPGTILVAHNTLYGNVDRHAAIVLGNVEGEEPRFRRDDVSLVNNLVAGLIPYEGEPDLNVLTTWNVAGLEAAGNVYDPSGTFAWSDGRPVDLDLWRALAGTDHRSTACTARLISAIRAEPHLRSDDACAAGAGVDLPSGVGADIDGHERRPGDPVDAGADALPRR